MYRFQHDFQTTPLVSIQIFYVLTVYQPCFKSYFAHCISIIDVSMYFPYKVGQKMTGNLSSVGRVITFSSTHTVLYLIVSSHAPGVHRLEFSQVNSHTIQPPQVVGVAMDTVASYLLSFIHSVRYVQDHRVNE